MGKLEQKIRNLENYKAIKECLPFDHLSPFSLDEYVRQAAKVFPKSLTILDLGCGEGNSVDLFNELAPHADWHGVDIENSPEVRNRTRESNKLKTFDGVNLPFPDNSFDLIYCNQVLEHVRYPDKLIVEAFRVLKPKGLFAGGVSYLEPFHSYSIFNFTPYGVYRVFSDAGFTVQELRPGYDASRLINRQFFNRSPALRFLWNRNYLHFLCDLIGRAVRLEHRERNFLKIQFSGHLLFLAKRPATESSNAESSA